MTAPSRLALTKTHLVYILVLTLITAAPLIAEEIRLTTYYPAPQGSYDDLHVRHLTVDELTLLGMSGDLYRIGIGEPSPQEKLDVKGRILMSEGVISAGGNARGRKAVDLQTERQVGINGNPRVASGDFSVIAGGSNNTASSAHSFVGGGSYNWAGPDFGDGYNAIVGGSSNKVEGSTKWSSIGGGQSNTINGLNRVIANTLTTSTIGGGSWNEIRASNSTIAGGWTNKILPASEWEGVNSFIGGGSGNIVRKNWGTVAGGSNNEAGNSAFVGGGLQNKALGDYSAIPGGGKLDLKGTFSFGFNATNTPQTVTKNKSAVFLVDHFGIGTADPETRSRVTVNVDRVTAQEYRRFGVTVNGGGSVRSLSGRTGGISLTGGLGQFSLNGFSPDWPVNLITGVGGETGATDGSYRVNGSLGVEVENDVMRASTGVFGSAVDGTYRNNIVTLPGGPFRGNAAYAGYFSGNVIVTAVGTTPESKNAGRLIVGYDEPTPRAKVVVSVTPPVPGDGTGESRRHGVMVNGGMQATSLGRHVSVTGALTDLSPGSTTGWGGDLITGAFGEVGESQNRRYQLTGSLGAINTVAGINTGVFGGTLDPRNNRPITQIPLPDGGSQLAYAGYFSGNVVVTGVGPGGTNNRTGRLSVGQESGNPVFVGFHKLVVWGSAAKPGGGAWADTGSDIAYKTNVQPINGALDKMLALHGVTFEYKEPEKMGVQAGPRMGMIANEVEKVFPQWVGRNDDGNRHLAISGFEALTIEALRELRAENERLRAEIERLKEKNQP